MTTTLDIFRNRLDALNVHANSGIIYTQSLLLLTRMRYLLAHNPAHGTPRAYRDTLQQVTEHQLALAATFDGSEKLSARQLNHLALQVLQHYQGNKAELPTEMRGWHNEALSA